MHLRVAATVAFAGLTCSVRAAPSPAHVHAGDVFEVVRVVEATEKGSKGSSSSSKDRDTLVERIIGASREGLQLEYDLPTETPAEDRARQWQFPVRVLRPKDGPLQLLNGPELTTRAAAWLKAAGLTASACGHWYFTWNAFQVLCDPQSVIETVKGFDLGPDSLAVGSLYQDPQALSPATLRSKGGTTVLYGETVIDPDAVRRGRAQADVVTAEIMRKPVTFESALRAHAIENVSGTVAITFEIDAGGHPKRQTKVITVSNKGPDGTQTTRTVRQTLERQLGSQPGS